MGAVFKKSYITNNPYFNDKRWLTGKDFLGFFLHSVGCAQPDPMIFINSWNNSDYTRAGVNGFIDTTTAYIIAPCFDTPGTVKRMPHAGSPANNHYIGFEMTEPRWIQYGQYGKIYVSPENLDKTKAFVRGTYNVAVELFARLCLFHNKNPLQEGVIFSHREGALKGIATDHGDPEHLWNYLKLGYTMDTFRQAVANKMKEQMPDLVMLNNTDMSSLFPQSNSYDSYSTVLSSIPGMEIVPYMATLDRNTRDDINYDKLKSIGVVGVCIEAGYLYDMSHRQVDNYNSPKFRKQVDSATKAKMPFALYATTRAKSVDEAKLEAYYLSFCIRTAPPELGFWLKLKLSNSLVVNNSILNTYASELERMGLKDKIGLYVSKSELSQISWEQQSNKWWLWIDSHLPSVSAMGELLTPHTFAINELK